MSNASASGETSKLANFPVSIFSIVMGICGLAIAWQRAQRVFENIGQIWLAIAMLATILFAGFLLGYAAKFIRYREQVIAEWKHPIRVNFFPTISISLLLLSVVWKETSASSAYILWLLGSVIHIGFTVAILSSWMYHSHYELKHATPAWFIPVVGNLFVPISAISFGLSEIGWFYFSIGIVFWIVLMTIVLYRVFFHDPIPPRLLSTLFILIAPPAVGFISYSALIPELDAFGRILYYTALFITILLFSNAGRFIRQSFFLSSWAYSFPLAAITIASFLMAHRTGNGMFVWLAFGLLAILSVIVLILALKTIDAAARKTICVPE